MILEQITKDRREAVEQSKLHTSFKDLMKQIEKNTYQKQNFRGQFSKSPVLPIQNTINRDLSPNSSIKIIAEVKKASPSKGLICKDFDYISIAKDYEDGGAVALSVLTEPKYFQGDNKYLSEIKKEVNVPILRKDFIIDEWQIFEAKAIGADAILLIVAALGTKELKTFLSRAHELELDCLVETHDEEEVEQALESGAQIIGVNNRNLKTFEVNLEVSHRLRGLVPSTHTFIAESGIHTLEDIRLLKEIGVDGVLIGESVVKASDRVAKLKEFIEA